MSRLCFVSPVGGSAFMDELLAAVAHEVAELGYPTRTSCGALPDGDEDVAVVIPHEYFVLTPPEEHPAPHQLARTIGLCVEHPGNATFETSAQWAGRLGAVMDINRDGVEELARRGLPAHRFHLGYSSLWDRWHGQDRARTYDLTYLGTTDARRDFLLGSQARAMCEWRTRLLIPPHEQMTRPRPDFLMGADKYDHLADSSILLNLHRGASRSLEWVRVLEAMCNGCVVVSEQSTDYDPFVPGVHLAFARGQSLVAVASSLLRAPERLAEMRHAAYDFCTRHLSMAPSAQLLVDLAESLLGNGAAPPTATVAPARRGSQPVTPEPAPPPHHLPQLPDWATSVPTGVRERLVRAHATALLSGTVEVAQRGPLGGADARVDALVSTAREDTGLARTVRGLECQDVPVRILVGTASVGDDGLGVAHAVVRNELLGRVEAPYVLVLQPGQELLLGGLGRLCDALDADPNAAASYGMLFDEGTGTLWNALPLELERLTRRAYLGTPLLVRASAVAELGGFDTDVTLIGYEDHDFWLRFARAGLRAAFVAEIVAVGSRTRSPAFSPATWLPEATMATLLRHAPPSELPLGG